MMKNISRYKTVAKVLCGGLLVGMSLTGCDDVFEPALENITDIDAMYSDPTYAQGLMLNTYILLDQVAYNNGPTSDLATDDAVTNQLTSDFVRMGTGGWTSNLNPVSVWQTAYNAIEYCNIVLENYEKVPFSKDKTLNTLFCRLFKGDALGMRAIYHYYLLRNHAGMVDGQMLGIPLLLGYKDYKADFNTPRNTYAECVAAIMKDLNDAIELLPEEFKDLDRIEDMPQEFRDMGVTLDIYKRAFGNHQKGKVNKKILRAVRAQVALMAASPAFAPYSNVTMEQAAQYAAEAIDGRDLAAEGHVWYNSSEVDNIADGNNSSECIWQTNAVEGNQLERDNFPPSINGGGHVNPSQNLVDAFPMLNGYPISDPQGQYDPNKPYANRDKRLAAYILYDGQTMGATSSVITCGTYAEGANDKLSGINFETGRSTRTGYYMRKLLRPDINLASNSTTTKKHYVARIRLTEMYLNLAEALNEAYDPYHVITVNNKSYSAYSIIKAIRTRAEIGESGYLQECAADKDKMRQLIRNERRIELCFENHRFWDLRRWNVSADELSQPVRGMKISKENNVLTYSVLNSVEKRQYADYQKFGPIPYSETLKYGNLQQNTGW